MVASRALVLGGGGVVGIAWETGVLLGLADMGVDLSGADMVIGTSAGAVVAAQLTSGTPLDELFARQLGPPEESGEIPVVVGVEAIIEMFASAVRGASSPVEARVAIGRASLLAETVDEATRRAVIAHRLPSHAWPAADLRVTAVDTETGDLTVFTRTSGVDLVDAVAASAAVPGIWPPVTINGRRYVDGGMRSGTNADLAAPFDRVVIISPVVLGPMASLDPAVTEAVTALLDRPATASIVADDDALVAMGPNPLDTATRAASAHAGRKQGRAAAATIAALW